MSRIGKHFYLLCEKTLNQVEKTLDYFLEISNAQCVMLIDRTGYLIYQSGSFEYLHPEEVSTLSAGAFYAFQSMTDMCNKQEMTMQFYDPLNCGMYYLQINKYVFALTLYKEKSVNALDLRDLAHDYLLQLSVVLNRDETEVGENQPTEKFIMQKLDEMFG